MRLPSATSAPAALLVALGLLGPPVRAAVDDGRTAGLAPAPADLSITIDDGVTRAIPSLEVVYLVVVRSSGPAPVAGARVEARVPVALADVSWQCSASPGAACAATPPAPSGNGLGDVDQEVYLPPGGEVVFSVRGTLSVHAQGTLEGTASVSPPPGVPDPDLGDNLAADVDQVFRPFRVAKEVSGTFLPGEAVLYAITLVNETPVLQPDNDGPEFVDTLPPELQVTGATVSSGTVAVDEAGNRVTWNGAIPGGGVVTLTVRATIRSDAGGKEVVNQGTLHFALGIDPSTDALGNGATNDGLAFTEDPRTGGATVFQVLGGVLGVPALDALGLVLLALVLGLIATGALGRT